MSWNIIEKNNIWPRGDSNLRRRSQSTDMLCSRPSCLLTETGDAGLSPQVASWVFFNDVS